MYLNYFSFLGMESDQEQQEADKCPASEVLSEEEVRFFIGLVHKWYRVICNKETQSVETSADLDASLRKNDDKRGARYQLWSLQMQCKFG